MVSPRRARSSAPQSRAFDFEGCQPARDPHRQISVRIAARPARDAQALRAPQGCQRRRAAPPRPRGDARQGPEEKEVIPPQRGAPRASFPRRPNRPPFFFATVPHAPTAGLPFAERATFVAAIVHEQPSCATVHLGSQCLAFADARRRCQGQGPRPPPVKMSVASPPASPTSTHLEFIKDACHRRASGRGRPSMRPRPASSRCARRSPTVTARNTA